MFEPLHGVSLIGAICPFSPSAHITHCHTGLALRTAFQIPHLAHPSCIHVSLQAAPGQPAAFSLARVPSQQGKASESEDSAQHQAVPKTLVVPTNMKKTGLSLPMQMKEQCWLVPGVLSKHTWAQSPARTQPHTPSSA